MDENLGVLSREQFKIARLQSAQFVYALDPRTLLPIDLAAADIGKAKSTFYSDQIRRPGALPKITRCGKKSFVSVADLLSWMETGRLSPETAEPGRCRGGPTKAESAARRIMDTMVANANQPSGKKADWRIWVRRESILPQSRTPAPARRDYGTGGKL